MYPSLFTDEIVSPSMSVSEKNFKVREFYVFYECKDQNGRILISERSNMFRIPEPETKVEEGIEEINSSINNSINEAISSNPLGQAADNAATNNSSVVTDPTADNRTVLSPNTPSSTVDDTAISVDSGTNSLIAS